MVMPRKWKNPTSTVCNGKQKMFPEYNQWNGILVRCNAIQEHGGKNQTYLDCTYVEEWQSYDTYVEWARQQVGFLNREANGKLWSIDKDILCRGNTRYCPELCVFVPAFLNTFLLQSNSIRGELPIGVCRSSKGSFVAQIRNNRLRERLGSFSTPLEAFNAYKNRKECLAKELAIKYQGLVDPRVITALQNFTVNIDD